jgi:hypothetical protein
MITTNVLLILVILLKVSNMRMLTVMTITNVLMTGAILHVVANMIQLSV